MSRASRVRVFASRQASRLSVWRLLLAAGALVSLSMMRPLGCLEAQEVGPPVAEYRGQAIGSFMLYNRGDLPLLVVLEPVAFRQDSTGRITYLPLDTTQIRVRLSAMTIRIPPRGSASVSYEAKAQALPAWFVITATFKGARRQGVAINLELPHVVYLYQKAAVAHQELSASVLSSTGDTLVLRVENAGSGLVRCPRGTLRLTDPAGKASEVNVPAFPLFPGFRRRVELSLPAGAILQGGELQCGRDAIPLTPPPVQRRAP